MIGAVGVSAYLVLQGSRETHWCNWCSGCLLLVVLKGKQRDSVIGAVAVLLVVLQGRTEMV